MKLAHLKLCLGYVDFTPVDELDNEFEVVEADVLRHDDGRVLAGVRQQQLLKVRAARGEYHLRRDKRTADYRCVCSEKRDASAKRDENLVCCEFVHGN